jgi:hypothetical protein
MDAKINMADKSFPQNQSAMFDPLYFGAPPDPTTNNFSVNTGVFYGAGWVTTLATSPYGPVNCYANTACGGPLTHTLKRWFTPTVVLTYGPSQIFSSIASSQNFVAFENYIEGPHSSPHRWVAFQMISMCSPDDPLFFSHHANVDRLYAIWQDCHDLELVAPANYTTIEYSNITNYAGNGNPYWNYGMDSPIPFFWLPGNQDSFAIPNSPFPTARNVCSMGTEEGPNYDGLYVRYINDALVGALGQDINGQSTCPNNKAGWNLVYPPGATNVTRKRNIEVNSTTNSTSPNRDAALNGIINAFAAAAAAGLSGIDALNYIALQECKNSQQMEIDESLEAWMMDQGTQPEQYHSLCDSPSQRYYCDPSRANLGKCKNGYTTDQNTQQIASQTIAVFLGLCGGILVVVVIIVIVVMKRKRQNERLEGGELPVDQYQKLDG